MKLVDRRFGRLWSETIHMPATAALEQLSRALDQASTPIERIRPEQSNAPTPCSGFDLPPVVNHMVYDLQSFASMLKSAPRGSPDIDLIDGDWIAAYRSAAANLLATWHQRGTEEPLKLQMGEMPAAWGVGQHLAEIAVHAWDVARDRSANRQARPGPG